MRIILSTHNPSKAEQIKAMFSDPRFSVFTLDEVGVRGGAIEDGQTLTENALKKALYAHQRGAWSMADDTGLFIHALVGQPGVHSARWAGPLATTQEIMRHTLRQLEGVKDRSATFETIVALISPRGKKHFFRGKVEGKLLEAPRLPPRHKMPYNSIFVPNGQNLVLGEMSLELENSISHRGQAFRAARKFFEGFL